MKSQAEPDTRKLKPNRSRRMVYQFPSLKNGKPAKVEEWIELHYCYLLEFDDSVLSYVAQPPRFEAAIDGKVRVYRPDFAVWRAHAEVPVFVECKPERNLETFARTRSRFQPIIEELGSRLEVWTDTEARSHCVNNIKIIYPYALQAVNELHKAVVLQILKDIGGPVSFGEVVRLSHLGSAANFVIYQLLFHKLVAFNRHSPLTLRSTIALDAGNLKVSA